jgi:hypothetical protein
VGEKNVIAAELKIQALLSGLLHLQPQFKCWNIHNLTKYRDFKKCLVLLVATQVGDGRLDYLGEQSILSF